MIYEHLLREHFHLLEKSAYIPEENEGEEGVIDCSFGVSPFGYSEKIQPAMIASETDLENYPPFPYNEMKDAIISYWRNEQHLPRAHIHVCAGTMLILNYLNVLFLEKGDRVLGYAPQFPEFVKSVRVHGGVYDAVPLRADTHYTFCAEDLIRKLKRGAYKLVYIDNPNNPTGQIIPIQQVEAVVREAHRAGICVIVDEAYGEYMEKKNSAITLLSTYDNVFVLRSFSKGYALPSIRIGYVVAGKELSSYYSYVDDLLLNPFGLRAAMISLGDDDFLDRTIERTKKVKAMILRSLEKLQVLATAETTPIFLLQHPDEAVDLQQLLRASGVVTTAGFDNLGQNAVRVRIPQAPAPLIEVLKNIEKGV